MATRVHSTEPKLASKVRRQRVSTPALLVNRFSNRYGEYLYVKLTWQKGKKDKAKSLGPIFEYHPCFLLDVVLRACEILNVDELIKLREARKTARW